MCALGVLESHSSGRVKAGLSDNPGQTPVFFFRPLTITLSLLHLFYSLPLFPRVVPPVPTRHQMTRTTCSTPHTPTTCRSFTAWCGAEVRGSSANGLSRHDGKGHRRRAAGNRAWWNRACAPTRKLMCRVHFVYACVILRMLALSIPPPRVAHTRVLVLVVLVVLADTGLEVQHFITPVASCCPARTAFLTGRCATGVWVRVCGCGCGCAAPACAPAHGD